MYFLSGRYLNIFFLDNYNGIIAAFDSVQAVFLLGQFYREGNNVRLNITTDYAIKIALYSDYCKKMKSAIEITNETEILLKEFLG